MKTFDAFDTVALVRAEREHIEEVLQSQLDAPGLSLLTLTIDQLPLLNVEGMRAFRLLQCVCRGAEQGRAIDAGALPQFLQAGETLIEQMCSERESILDYAIQALSAAGGGSGLWAMAAKTITLCGIYTLVWECEHHFGPLSAITRTLGGLSALVFAALWTELIYYATRTASPSASAQWKGWWITGAGGLFAFAASTNNIFLLHPVGLAVAVCGSVSALGIWLSLYVAALRQRYGDPHDS